MKFFSTMLLALSLASSFGVAQSKSDSAPQLTTDQKVKLVQFMWDFQKVQKDYSAYIEGLCKSSDGKKYVVDFPPNGSEPSCKEVPAAAAAPAPPVKK